MSKATTIKELEENNGAFDYEGKHYVLLQQAYITGTGNADDNYAFYTATAICTEDHPDENGWQPCYDVAWDMSKEYIEWCEEHNDWSDEGDACDWEHPASVTTTYKEYSLTKNYIV